MGEVPKAKAEPRLYFIDGANNHVVLLIHFSGGLIGFGSCGIAPGDFTVNDEIEHTIRIIEHEKLSTPKLVIDGLITF